MIFCWLPDISHAVFVICWSCHFLAKLDRQKQNLKLPPSRHDLRWSVVRPERKIFWRQQMEISGVWLKNSLQKAWFYLHWWWFRVHNNEPDNDFWTKLLLWSCFFLGPGTLGGTVWQEASKGCGRGMACLVMWEGYFKLLQPRLKTSWRRVSSQSWQISTGLWLMHTQASAQTIAKLIYSQANEGVYKPIYYAFGATSSKRIQKWF